MLEQFNILDWIIIVISAFFVIKALRKGFLRELGSLVGLVVAIWGGFYFYQTLADFLRRVVGKQDFWWETLSFIICFAIIYFIIITVAARLSKVLYPSAMSGLNRLLGGLVGLVKGLILCFIIINLIMMMQPAANSFSQDQLIPDDLVGNSYLAPYIVEGGQKVLGIMPDFSHSGNYSPPLDSSSMGDGYNTDTLRRDSENYYNRQ